MPLVRVQVRNEYGLGRPELYKGTNKEDPKAVLDGVVVAGLVGILRQLGDLADFAAEVFHGLQEQVLTTTSRSHKLMLRAQNIEASLPLLEKAILAQTSHIHFAYTAGCEWHSRAKTEQNHFIYNDLPQFIMDSYEECRNPPSLHLLDKYDPGGQGSCLRRYSDPTFFRRVSADSDEAHIEKTEISWKTSRSKKKRLSRRNGETLQGDQMHSNGGRRTSSSQTADVVLESDLEDHSSVDSRADVGQRKSLSQRNGEAFLGDQMHGNDGRETSSSQTADVVLESDLEDHSYSVDSRADVGQRKSFSQRNGEILPGEHMLSNDGRMQFASHVNGQTSSSETADTVLESDLEDHSYSVDSRADVGLRKSLSQRNGETLQGEQMHSNDSRMQFALDVNGQTSNSQTVVEQRKSFSCRNGETLQGEQMHSNDSRMQFALDVNGQTSSSQTAVEQRKSFSCRNGETLQGEQLHSNDSRMLLASHVNGQTSSSQTADMVLESDLEDHSYSVDLRDDAGYIECVFRPSNSVQFDEQECKESPSPRLTQKTDFLQSASPTTDYNFSQGSFDKQIASTSTGLTWDEKEETVDSESQWCDKGEIPKVPFNLYMHEDEPFAPENSDFIYSEERNLKPASSMVQTDETDSEPDNYLDALNTIESESENDLDCRTKREAEQFTSHVSSEVMGNGVGATSTELDHDFYNVFSHTMSNVSLNKETDLDFPETLQEIQPHISERHITSLRNPVQSGVPDNIEGTNILVASYDYGSPIHEPVPDICGNSVLECSVGLNPLDNTCSLNDTVSTSIETVPSNAPANIESERSLVDSHGSESPIHEQEPHQPANYILDCFVHGYDSGSPIHEPVPEICGNSVLDCSVGPNPLDDACSLIDTGSTSIKTVPSNAPVNIESIRKVDSHGSKSPTHQQEPHQPAKYVLDCFVHGYNSGSPIHEPVPDICGNSVLDCSVGPNPLDDTCSFNDTVSPSIETVPSNAPVNIESKRKVDSHGSESPTHEQDPHQPASYALDCSDDVHILDNDTESPSIETVLSSAPVNIESKRKVDSHGSESPTHEQDPHQPANYVLDCSDDVHILDNAVSVSIEPVQSNVNVDTERTESLGDAPEYHHVGQQVPQICGNSVFDSAHNDSLSASSENVRPDGFVNSETTKNLADSHAHQSPIHEQMSHVCEISALECSVGTNPLGDYPTLNDSVSASIEIDPSDDPVDFERTINLAGSHGSVSTIHEQLPHISGNSVLNCLGGTSPLGDNHTLHDAVSASIETDISSGSKSSDLPDKEADSMDSNVCKSKEAPSEPLSDPSVGLWTNGGLLGLEPSKPPDFILPSSLNQGLMTSTNDTDGVSNYNSMLKSNEFREDQDLLKIAELNQKEPRRYGQNDEDFDKNKVTAPGTVVPVAHTGFTEPIKGSGLNSPLLFGLGHKLLINSFCRRVSLDEKSGPDNSLKTGLLEQSGQNSTVQQSLPETTFKEQFSYEYPTYSPPPSPPLEHMKISFCPVDRFETFKLKLKFPDLSHHSDSTRDVFPSFWLVPEHSILLHDSGSNSDDDDTFCRSSTFVSDDCLTPHSDYNSDQWESDDTPDISGDGVYDSSHRISLIESKSSSQEVRGVTDVDVNWDNEHIMLAQDSTEPSLSGHLLDFPSFDTMSPVLGKECNNHSGYDDNLKLQGHAESIPPAPPLPSNQWWLSNQRSDMMNDKQNCMSKVIEQINDPNISESTLQVRPTLLEQNPTDHKSNDDILDKLRNKSFNKKHTETGKRNDITSPTTTDKVAAILEKANAIRQVISSDDGEDDDCWSES